MENKKLTIGINASFARKPETGIGQVTANVLRTLANIKYQKSNLKDKEVEFILYLEEDLPRGLKIPKNFQKRIFLPRWKRDDLIRKIWWEKFLLPRKAKKDKCDIFISLYQCPTEITSARHIMVVHDIIPRLFPEYLNNSRKKHYQKSTEKAIKNADHIVAISRRTEKDLIEHLGLEGKKITASYIDVDEIYKKKPSAVKITKVLKKYKLKPGYILAGGGLEARKNIGGVIHAYKALLELNEKKNYVHEVPMLVIYGKLMPWLAPLVLDAQKLLEELNLTRQVKLVGVVPQDIMPALFSQASMFVYPSHYEGFGMPPLEAMNQGTPTIVSKKSSLPEVGGDGALYCNPDDADDIAMVMKNILKDKKLRETLSQRAKMQAKKFSWDKFTKKFLNIIAEKK